MRYLFILLSILMFWVTGLATPKVVNSDYVFTHLTSKDGLPHQQVETMVFDGFGRLWVGTRNGLAFYDGYSFRTFFHDPADSGSLAHNFVIKLFCDSKQRIWVGTEKGLSLYCPDTDSFINYDFGGVRIRYIAETHEGTILCGDYKLWKLPEGASSFSDVQRQDNSFVIGLTVSPDNEVFVISDHSICQYNSDFSKCSFLDRDIYVDFLKGIDDIVPMFFDKDGYLWIGRNGKGVVRIDTNSWQTKFYEASMLSNGIVRAITQDSDGRIWLGTEMGISILNPDSDDVDMVLPDFFNNRRLGDKAIYCMTPDSYGNMWIGTYFAGVNLMRKDGNKFRWISPGYDSHSIRGKVVRRIIEPTPSTLWMATEDAGVNLLNLKSGEVSRWDKIPGIGSNVHELLFNKHTNDLWIGCFRDGLYRYNLSSGAYVHYENGGFGLESNSIFSIAGQPTADGIRIWVGTTFGLRYYDPSTDTFRKIDHGILDADFIFCQLVDHKNNLWVGTLNNGLFRIAANDGKIDGWKISEDTVSGALGDNYITAIYEDALHNIFIGTNTGGLHVIKAGKSTVSSVSSEGIRTGTICSIIGDNIGHIWVSSSNGLFKIDSQSFKVHHFTTAEGLPENQFNFSSAMQASDGRMYFGTVAGLVSFVPELKSSRQSALVTHFWNLSLNNLPIMVGDEDSPLNEPLDVTEKIVLSYEQSRMFRIDYGVVAPAGVKSTLYQVLVSGIDEDWRDVGTQRTFTAMGFAPGTYQLQVRASKEPDSWDDAPVHLLVIKIEPPFYLSYWAFFAYFVLLIVVTWLVYRFTKIRINERNAMKISRMEKEKSDELNREKLEFFTNISHELKTPLSLILAPLKSISLHQPLTEESNKHLGVAITNTNRMIGLIDELVTFNRIESGNFQLFLQYDNPLTFIETMTQYFYETAQEKGITIQTFSQNNGENVWFSATYLERILNNLLSNAIKYTHDGGKIDVLASIEEGEADNIFLKLEVRDNGIGIAKEELENIFKKYYQTKRGYNTNHSGWGIGLATVRKLVETHKGTISVSSVIGEGSAFVVMLNVSEDAFNTSCRISPDAGTQSDPSYRRTVSMTAMSSNAIFNSEANSNDRTSILVVEDNQDLLQFLADTFKKTYNVYTAINGVEALKITEKYPIDVIVSDVMMPEMDGIQLCEHLKNDISTSHIPVILLTAKNDQETVRKGFEVGAEAYVTKPFDPQILELRVKNIIRARNQLLRQILHPSDELEQDVTDSALNLTNSEEAPSLNDFDKDFITHINRFVEENIENSEFVVADITREFGISRTVLHVKMKSLFGTSISDFIRDKRLEYAKQLMIKGCNVSETAYSAGYSNPNYFAKVFKKQFGITPSEFIQQL